MIRLANGLMGLYYVGVKVAKSTAVADEAIGNIRTVRAFAMEDKEMM